MGSYNCLIGFPKYILYGGKINETQKKVFDNGMYYCALLRRDIDWLWRIRRFILSSSYIIKRILIGSLSESINGKKRRCRKIAYVSKVTMELFLNDKMGSGNILPILSFKNCWHTIDLRYPAGSHGVWSSGGSLIIRKFCRTQREV